MARRQAVQRGTGEIARLSGLAKARMERDILKKRRRISRGSRGEIRFIERHRTVWPIVVQCRVLEVSVSGYGRYRRQAAAALRFATSGRLSDMRCWFTFRAVFRR